MTLNKAQQKYIDEYAEDMKAYGIQKWQLKAFAEGFKEISNEPDPELYTLKYTSSTRPEAFDQTACDLTFEQANSDLISYLRTCMSHEIKSYVAGEYLEKHDGSTWKVVKQ